MPHPTTLIRLVGRAGPEVIQELNAALLAKLAARRAAAGLQAAGAHHRGQGRHRVCDRRRLLEHAVRKLGGLVRRIQAGGAATRTRFRDRGRAAGRRMKQLAHTLRRRTGGR